MEKIRARNFCFTSFPNPFVAMSWDSSRIKYIVVGEEICPTSRRKHWQGYVEFHQSTSGRAAQRILGDPVCHIEKRKGTALQAALYCQKGEGEVGKISFGLNANIITEGEISRPGERTDLNELHEIIINQEVPIFSLVRESYFNYQQLCHVEKLQKYAIPKARKPPKVIWLWGPSGTGKSRVVRQKYGDDIFSMEGDFQWFDGYGGQEVALLDDYRGEIKYNTLLKVLDRYPLLVKIKCGFTNWIPETIIITSDRLPSVCYPMEDSDSLKQLERRITKILYVAEENVAEVDGNTNIDRFCLRHLLLSQI